MGYKPRSEYATEEEWQAAKARQETLPKAAFQFGVKMADGRKAQGKLGKGKTDQKINNALQKIQARAISVYCGRAALLWCISCCVRQTPAPASLSDALRCGFASGMAPPPMRAQ